MAWGCVTTQMQQRKVSCPGDSDVLCVFSVLFVVLAIHGPRCRPRANARMLSPAGVMNKGPTFLLFVTVSALLWLALLLDAIALPASISQLVPFVRSDHVTLHVRLTHPGPFLHCLLLRGALHSACSSSK